VKKLFSQRRYLLFLAPLLLFTLFFALYPLAYALFISFFDYRLTDPSQARTFIGLTNYLNAFRDPQVQNAIRNTLVFVIGAVSIEMVLGMGLALLFAEESRHSRWLRAWLLLPLALPPLVVGLVWRALYNADFGVISYYLKALGVDVGRGPLGEPDWAMPAVILVDVWQWTPLLMVIFLAGLKSLPGEPLEAAIADGATRWQRFWHITLPMLRPTILVALLLRTMQAFKVFDIIYATTSGGPGQATTVLNYHIYTVGLTFFRMGYAAALANILLIIVTLLAVLYLILLERRETV